MIEDMNRNNIPDKIDIVASIVVVACIAGLTVWGSMHPAVWIVVVVTSLSYLATVFKVGMLRIPAGLNNAAVAILGTATTALAGLQVALPGSTTWLLIAQGVVGALGGVFGMGAAQRPGKSQ